MLILVFGGLVTVGDVTLSGQLKSSGSAPKYAFPWLLRSILGGPSIINIANVMHLVRQTVRPLKVHDNKCCLAVWPR